MERRTFLKGMAAIAAAVLLPIPGLVTVSPVPQRYYTLMELARMNPVSPELIAFMVEPNPLLNLLTFKEIHGS